MARRNGSRRKAAGKADQEAEMPGINFEWGQTITRPQAGLQNVPRFGLLFRQCQMIVMLAPAVPIPLAPVRWLDPFRIANRYGLFAVMTHERYEIEFQGSTDGKNWTPYAFRYKPQDIRSAPGITLRTSRASNGICGLLRWILARSSS